MGGICQVGGVRLCRQGRTAGADGNNGDNNGYAITDASSERQPVAIVRQNKKTQNGRYANADCPAGQTTSENIDKLVNYFPGRTAVASCGRTKYYRRIATQPRRRYRRAQYTTKRTMRVFGGGRRRTPVVYGCANR